MKKCLLIYALLVISVVGVGYLKGHPRTAPVVEGVVKTVEVQNGTRQMLIRFTDGRVFLCSANMGVCDPTCVIQEGEYNIIEYQIFCETVFLHSARVKKLENGIMPVTK